MLRRSFEGVESGEDEGRNNQKLLIMIPYLREAIACIHVNDENHIIIET